jgi:hypothetical protein
MRKLFVSVVSFLLLTSCDSTRPDGPGTLTAVVTSPNGAEGAAVLDIEGTVESVTANSNVSLYLTPSGQATRAILVRLTPGELSMKVSLPDVSRTPQITVVEVADGDNKLRPSVSGYHVELR